MLKFTKRIKVWTGTGITFRFCGTTTLLIFVDHCRRWQKLRMRSYEPCSNSETKAGDQKSNFGTTTVARLLVVIGPVFAVNDLLFTVHPLFSFNPIVVRSTFSDRPFWNRHHFSRKRVGKHKLLWIVWIGFPRVATVVGFSPDPWPRCFPSNWVFAHSPTKRCCGHGHKVINWIEIRAETINIEKNH